ncbi:DUF1853 family protein [Gilvimarinus sp. F26214L]|uniref:DUF1853 family protein n=1 Tax=Gilvimarinus sp. DZF01 TaxID=3461371 RepID=UPI0040467777
MPIAPFDLLQFRTPAIRHLAWICHAPQLLTAPGQFTPAEFLPEDAEDRLKNWDRQPSTAPALLGADPPRRLGLYFEILYRCLLEDLLGWPVIAHNVPVRDAGRTLGELDFIVRNPHTGLTEHHEIAVKFYLGYGSDPSYWYGPNAKDRLDIKSQRLLDHQSRLCEREETRQVLTSLGIDQAPAARIFMPGYLFYPITTRTGGRLSSPESVPENHARGWWLYEKAARQLEHGHWRRLGKPHWLGPWAQRDEPDSAAADAELERVGNTGIPALFARLTFDSSRQLWVEAERLFVVPADWPKATRSNLS